MSASYITSVTGTNTATLPAHQVGDVFVAWAVRSGSSTPPVVPVANDWAEFDSGGSNSLGYAGAVLYATSTSMAAGTFTNATGLIIAQYRPAAGYVIEIGSISTALSGSATSASYPSLSLLDQGGTSVVLGLFANRASDITNLTTPPTGMVNRNTFQSGSNSLAFNASPAPLTSWTQQVVAYNGTANSYRTLSVELRVVPAQVAAAPFYYRTNFRSSTTRYFRTNELNAAIVRVPGLTISAAGITYQTVIGANIVTDITSGFHNLDFTPVAGDLLALPTRVGNSVLTLQANGRFSISPAVANGTQIPRRARDVSASTWYQDTITINNGAGTGQLFLSGPAVNGAGGLVSPRVGVGVVSLPAVGLSGGGTVSTSRGISRSLVTKNGVAVSAGTQVRAIVFDDLDPGFSVLHNDLHTVGVGGVLSFTSPNLPTVGSTVILALYDPGVASSGDQDIGMSARRVQVVSVT